MKTNVTDTLLQDELLTSQDIDAQQHIENGSAILALELMDQRAAFDVAAE